MVYELLYLVVVCDVLILGFEMSKILFFVFCEIHIKRNMLPIF